MIYDIFGNHALGKFEFGSNHVIEISKNKFISSKQHMSEIYLLIF